MPVEDERRPDSRPPRPDHAERAVPLDLRAVRRQVEPEGEDACVEGLELEPVRVLEALEKVEVEVAMDPGAVIAPQLSGPLVLRNQLAATAVYLQPKVVTVHGAARGRAVEVRLVAVRGHHLPQPDRLDVGQRRAGMGWRTTGGRPGGAAHGVLALMRTPMVAAMVVAASINQTYSRNAFNNGFICIECPSLVDALAEYELGVKRLDLLHQRIGQALARHHRQARNVVDRLFRIELGALATRAVEDVDDMAFQVEKPQFEHREQPHRASADHDDIGDDFFCRHWLLV